MDDCLRFFERFHEWHRDHLTGLDSRTMEEAGFTPAAFSQAVRIAGEEKNRMAAALQRAMKQRAELHTTVVRMRAKGQ
jgi:hypothetical protein